MTTTIDILPIKSEMAPDNADALADAVREAAENGQAVYALGGRTALDFGLVPSAEGIGLSTTGLNKIIDYDPRDLTVTAEAGVTIAQLAETLAAEGQELPIDVPRATDATLGGIVATNWNGPRRYGRGTLRDYLIGIAAVDGRGVAFKSGGRVMKNVAGYDFAKLLTGSLGTLAVVTQLTFKARPKAEMSAMMTCSLRDWDQADTLLTALCESVVVPSAIELFAGSARQLPLPGNGWVGEGDDEPQKPANSSGKDEVTATLALHVEGNAAELATMQETLSAEWSRHDVDLVQILPDDVGTGLFRKLVEFPDSSLADRDSASPLVIKIAVRPSRVTAMCRSVLEFDPAASIVAHAGSGIIFARFANITAGDASSVLVGKLRPEAISSGGSLVVIRTQFAGLTRQVIWGGRTSAHDWLRNAKHQFDPNGILSPGRLFVD